MGILPCSFIFIYLGNSFPPVISTDHFLGFFLYEWGVFPIMESIFFILVDRIFYRKNDFKIPFLLFLFFYCLSFFVIFLNIFDTLIYAISRQIASILIFGLCVLLLIKERRFSDWLFLLSLCCFTIGGIALSLFLKEPEYISNTAIVIFGFFFGFIFLALIFGKSKTPGDEDGIEVFFSLKNQLQKVESALLDTEQRYRQLIENVNEGIWVLDGNYKTTYINSFMTFILGYSYAEMVGKSFFEFLDNAGRNIAREKLKHTDNNINTLYEFDVLKKDKTFVSVSLRLSPLFDNKGNYVGAIAALQDISDRKRMERELREKLDKLQKSELATLNIMEDLQSTISALTLAETQIRDKNTELQKINNELTSAREELTMLNRNLEKKVKERTADVEKLLKQKDEFVSQLGHDLKTPLTPLNILIPIVREQEQDPKLKELLTVISNNVQYMKNLVIKTLELAQLSSPTTNFELHDVDLSSQLTDILDMEKILLQGKNVVFENKIPQNMYVKADLLQIRELFDNLISNAIKYSQENAVKITFDAKQKDDCIVVSITDTGIGLEPYQIPHVFDEFYKVDYSRHDLQSIGLGLSICKRIVEKHGGRIWAESPGKGKGSTFFFTLNTPRRYLAL